MTLRFQSDRSKPKIAGFSDIGSLWEFSFESLISLYSKKKTRKKKEREEERREGRRKEKKKERKTICQRFLSTKGSKHKGTNSNRDGAG